MIMDSSGLDKLHLEEDELKISSGKYQFIFEQIDSGIFRLKSSGYMDEVSIKAQFAVGDKIREKLKKTSPPIQYSLIWDISKIKGISIYSKNIISWRSKKLDNINCIVIIGANSWEKTFGKIINLMVKNFKVSFFNNEPEALAFIRQNIKSLSTDNRTNNNGQPDAVDFQFQNKFAELWEECKETIPIGVDCHKIIFKPEWIYEALDHSYKAKYSVMEDNVIYCILEGQPNLKHTEGTYDILNSIIATFSFNETTNKFYSLIDMTNIRLIPLSARKKTSELEGKFRKFAHIVVIIPSSPLYFALKIQKIMNPKNFGHWALTDSIENGLALIAKHRTGQMNSKDFKIEEEYHVSKVVLPSNKKAKDILIHKLYEELNNLKKNQHDNLEKILELSGRITWDDTFSTEIDSNIGSNQQFKDVYSSLGMLQQDFKEILREKEQQSLKLRESEEKYHDLINLASDIIAVIQDGTVKYVNKAAFSILGYTTEEIIGNPIDFFFKPDLIEHLKNNYLHRISGAKIKNIYESVLIDKNGKEIPVSLNARVINYENKPAVMAMIRDITEKKESETEIEKYQNQLERLVRQRTEELNIEIEERKKTELELKAKNSKYAIVNEELRRAKGKAEESDRLKTIFLANMSHEIRTPMNGILGFASLLYNENLSHEKKTRFLDIINSNTKQLLTIITDIIDFSRIEAGQLEIYPRKCNINGILDQLKTFFEHEMNPEQIKNINLLLYKELSDFECNLVTDEIRVRQVFINLISNAFKFTSEGSIEFGYRIKNKHKVVFYVKDTGIGISPEKLDVVFRRFRQEDESTTRNYGGTGLGLAISKGIVELLGGEITVESVKGKGSVFTFTIPYRKEKNQVINDHLENDEEIRYDWSQKTVLIVEDVELGFQYLNELLEETGIRILHVTNGLDSIKACETNPEIDIVLMDIQLPDINGQEATKKIKSFREKLPIIAQTAYALSGDRQLIMKCGCDGYISKPINRIELFKIMEEFL
jgi:PAS domain S-box-containing protein